MPTAPNPITSSNPLVGSLLAEYQEAIAAGVPLSIHELLARHPEASPELAPVLAAALRSQDTVAQPSTPATAGTLDASSLPPPDGAVPLGGQFGDYELLGEIARGGMGVVYKARQTSLGRVVALKMILAGSFASADQVRRFHHEAEQIGRMDHPHIIAIFQVGEHQGQHYFSMQLIEGGSLSHHMDRFRAEPRSAARLIARVARAVHYAHQRGILHRDLKPANILLDGEGQPHVTDFGLAKHMGTNSETQSGAILGTPSYMAPEQAAARKDLSTAVDVYALGAILYELLTGRPPFQADSPLETVMQVLAEAPLAPRRLNPTCDRDLETICLKCLEKEPTRRYSSAEALANDLERWVGGESILARPASGIERSMKWVRRRPAMAALVAVSAVAVLALGVLGWVASLRLDRAWKAAEAHATQAETNATQAEANAATARANASRAEASAADARRQRDEVNTAFRKRQDTVDALLVRIDRRLENYGGALASVRMEFLNEFLKLNDDLMRERGKEPSLRRQAAQLHQRIGDLQALRNDSADGVGAYQKAIDYYRGLIKEGPASEQDRVELAYTCSQLAALQKQARRYQQARKACEEAIRLRDQMVIDYPRNPIHRFRTASYRFALADLLDEWGKPKDAETCYRRALKDQEQLVKDHPGEAGFREGMLQTAGSLAVLLEPSQPEEARRLLERIARTCGEVARTNPAYLDRVVNSGYDLAAHLQARGRHADLSRLAAAVTRDFSTSSEIHYHATCYAARALLALNADKALAPGERTRLAGTYARQAVELLGRAVQLGWKDRQHMFLDGDLDPLRPRQEFRDLMAELDRRVGKPLAVDELVTYLSGRYRSQQASVQAMLAGARTVAERKKAGANWPKPEEFAQRCLSLAEQNPKESAAVSALGQVLLITSSRAMASLPVTAKLRDRAFELMERDHLKTPAFADVCASLGSSPSDAGDRLLRTAFEKHALPEVRGRAGFWLARSLAQQAERAHASRSPREAVLFRRAEELYERVAKEHGSAAHGSTTLGEAASTQLHALRHLSIGRPAEDVIGNDLDGKEMKLTDFRGKVVLLSFWANWCGFCRQMYPHEKALVKKYANRPFALVGVNGDNDQEELRRELKRHGITWRSWADASGKIRGRWQTDALPEVFILDHKGVIRHHYQGLVRGTVIDDALDKLLAECQEDKTKP